MQKKNIYPMQTKQTSDEYIFIPRNYADSNAGQRKRWILRWHLKGGAGLNIKLLSLP